MPLIAFIGSSNVEYVREDGSMSVFIFKMTTFSFMLLLYRPEQDASQKLHRKNLKHQAHRRRFQRMRNARKRIREQEKALKRARQSKRRDRVKYMNEDI